LEKPILSFVIPTWNRSTEPIQLMEAIGHFNDPQVEIVITDNNSEEKHISLLRSFVAGKPQVRLSENPSNVGMVANWNRCIELARGEWICFVCSDDLILDGSVEYLLERIRTIGHPAVVIQDPSLSQTEQWLPPGSETARQLRLPIVSGNCWHKTLTAQLGAFDVQLKYSPDAEFWTRLSVHFPVLKVRRRIAKYLDHGENYAYTTWRKDDFLDQVDLITQLNARHFGLDPQGDAFKEFRRRAIDDTIGTILGCVEGDSSKLDIFRKYDEIRRKREPQKPRSTANRLAGALKRVSSLPMYVKKLVHRVIGKQ
jgi:glycosyltransferase involved in cell wall biosynthesis